jgi:hypothetical protein
MNDKVLLFLTRLIDDKQWINMKLNDKDWQPVNQCIKRMGKGLNEKTYALVQA